MGVKAIWTKFKQKQILFLDGFGGTLRELF